jgi:predicted transposase YbfD/YdcC
MDYKSWAVENKLHWVLDVTFKEDYSRKRKSNAPGDFNIILKIALTILTKDKETKVSCYRKGLRLHSTWNTEIAYSIF